MFQVTNMPKHNLLVKNLKAKWNNVNRDVVYILYEIYYKSKRLRHNLSSQALKQYDLLTDQIVQSHLLANNNNHHFNMRQKQHQPKQTTSHQNTSNIHLQQTTTDKSSGHASKTNSHMKGNNSHTNATLDKEATKPDLNAETGNKFFEDLLNKLDAERNVNLNVYCDETNGSNQSTGSNFTEMLYGLNAIHKMSDIVNEHIFIELINSQIKLSLDDNADVTAGVNGVAAAVNQAKQQNTQKGQKRSQQESKTNT